MASTVASLIAIARRHLNEPTETSTSFWSDTELAALIDKGARDLFRAINDNYQHYFATIDITNVSQVASATSLTGVPSDVGIIRGIEPLALSTRPGLCYFPRDYNHIDFQRARQTDPQDASFGLSVFYCVMGAGAPVSAPTIQVAPAINTTVALRLTYVPSLAAITSASNNPIPGESDNALIAWCVAYAMAKRTEEQEPHAGWLSLYGTEKANILASLSPRQTDEPDCAEAMFEDEWQ
jgi:hypothetical protein